MNGSKRFCVLDCDPIQVWKPTSFGDMFTNALREVHDYWNIFPLDNYYVPKSMPDPLEYDGIVITGSHYNIRDGFTLPWFDDLIQLILICYDSGRPALYGGCFGCQIIAHSLGGSVGFNKCGRFLCKAENIVPVIPLSNCLKVPNDEADSYEKSSYQVIVSHGDCVLSLPPNSTLLATSTSCENEIFMVGKQGKHVNILACQSHPEFDVDYCIWERIWPIAVIGRKRLSEEEKQMYEPTLRTFIPDNGANQLLGLIKLFLHQELIS